MKVIFYDCFAGISGDMNLGAMLDLGIDKEYLINELKKLKVKEYEIKIGKKIKRGIQGIKVDVLIEKREQKHIHRNLKDISNIINISGLNQNIKDLSLKMFTRIAEAEAKIHGKSINEIHFHEVGAIDSIIDIVGAAICFDYFNPEKILCSSIELGGGFVKCAHGTFPVPAPATVEILKDIPVKFGLLNFETTTPTGATIIASNVDEFVSQPEFEIQKIGYGLGTKDPEDAPNILRVYYGELTDLKGNRDKGIIVECNIDDMNPENYNYIIEKLFNNGANDVFITPIIMKKNRPAVKLSVLCKKEFFTQVSDILLKETTTFGLRYYEVTKTALERKSSTVLIDGMEIRIKSAYYDGKFLKYKPEHDDCYKLAKEKDILLREVYHLVEQKMNMKNN